MKLDKLITEVLKPNLSNIRRCIYCEETLPAKNKEHIFNSCWGGVHKTGNIICDQCNSSFSAIDGVFDIYTRFIMNANQFKGQRHKKIPEITTESEYYIGAGGKPIRNSTARISKDEDGTVKIAVNANSKSESRKLIFARKKEIESNLGRTLTPEEEENIYQKIRESEYTSEKVGTLGINVELEIHNQYRSAAHTILKCLTMYDTLLIDLDEVKTLKRFARYDEGSWTDFAILGNANVSFMEQFDKSNKKFNSVEIFYSSKLKKIIGCLNILGYLKRWIIISNTYTGNDKMLFVFEEIGKGGKIDALKFEVKDITLPIISIQSSIFLNGRFFSNELQTIAQESLSIDAPIHELRSNILKICNNNELVSQKVIQEITIALLNFGKLFLSENVVEDTESILLDSLNNLGMKNLSDRYEGQSINNEKFAEDVSEILESYMNYIVLKLNNSIN